MVRSLPPGSGTPFSASGSGMLPTKWTIGLCADAALIVVASLNSF